MENLIKEIKSMTTLTTFLRDIKYSKGLSTHDIEIYENAKKELNLLNEKLEKLDLDDDIKKLLLSQN